MNIILRDFRESDYDAFALCHGPQGLNAITPPNEETFRKVFDQLKTEVNLWAIDVDGNFAGQISFKNARNTGVAEVSYMVTPSFQGRGIATVATNQIIVRAFSHGVLKLWARTTILNVPSFRVLERCGFSKEGHMRSQRLVLGALVDELYYGLTLEDYEKMHR